MFERYAPISAVSEPVKVPGLTPAGLLNEEADLYRYLLSQERGRLEQEYLPRSEVSKGIADWVR